MEKPTFTRTLVQSFILLLMGLSIVHSHECCIKADINDVYLYDTILAASYASLFALKSKLANLESNKTKRHVWLTRGSILLLLFLPHILCGINAPVASVSSATVIDNETAVALAELIVLEILIDIWLGKGGNGPDDNANTKPKNKEGVS